MEAEQRTEKFRIKAALRKLWLWSRERNATIKRDNYTCQKCQKKQSRKKGAEIKVQVHHIDGIKWDFLIEEIYNELLVHPDKLQTLCTDCHKQERKKITDDNN